MNLSRTLFVAGAFALLALIPPGASGQHPGACRTTPSATPTCGGTSYSLPVCSGTSAPTPYAPAWSGMATYPAYSAPVLSGQWTLPSQQYTPTVWSPPTCANGSCRSTAPYAGAYSPTPFTGVTFPSAVRPSSPAPAVRPGGGRLFEGSGSR